MKQTETTTMDCVETERERQKATPASENETEGGVYENVSVSEVKTRAKSKLGRT